jgi:nucleoside-diphosphate-sugar epimerase
MIALGHRVTAVTRTAKQRAMLTAAGAIPVEVDLFDRESVRRAMAGSEVVVNLATHVPASTVRMFLPGAWRENSRLRREATATLAGAASDSGVRRYIQESFAPVYPDLGDAWIREETPLAPIRYNRTVIDAEAAAQDFTR